MKINGQETNPQSEFLKEVAGANGAELPPGAAPVAAADDAKVIEMPKPPEPEPDKPAVAASAEPPPASAKKIRIGDQEFTSQDEAIAYAEKLENEKEKLELYNMAVQETLNKVAGPAAHTTPPIPPEEDFDAQFYVNPKEYLAKERERAKNEIRQELTAEKKEREAWDAFFQAYPDLADHKRLCDMVLKDDWETLKVQDFDRVGKHIARKVRGIFQAYDEKRKPTQELPKAPVAASSAGVGSPASVTPTAKPTQSLDFISEFKQAFKRA